MNLRLGQTFYANVPIHPGCPDPTLLKVVFNPSLSFSSSFHLTFFFGFSFFSPLLVFFILSVQLCQPFCLSLYPSLYLLVSIYLFVCLYAFQSFYFSFFYSSVFFSVACSFFVLLISLLSHFPFPYFSQQSIQKARGPSGRGAPGYSPVSPQGKPGQPGVLIRDNTVYLMKIHVNPKIFTMK